MLTELHMPQNSAQLDAPTSRAVANGIGERLRQALGGEAAFPDKLQKLLDEMRDREARAGGDNRTTD